jgi:hypothetical protein
LPVLGFADFILYSCVNLVFCFVRLSQTVLLYLFFSNSKVKPVFGFQFLANLFVPVHIVFIGYGLAVVVYPVEYDMHVRMLPVLVAHNDILRIGDFHFMHIFLRQLYHLLVRQLGCIYCRIT